MIYNKTYRIYQLEALSTARRAKRECNPLLRMIAIESALMWRRLSRFKA